MKYYEYNPKRAANTSTIIGVDSVEDLMDLGISEDNVVRITRKEAYYYTRSNRGDFTAAIIVKRPVSFLSEEENKIATFEYMMKTEKL